MNYGTLVIVDGVDAPPPSDDGRSRRGLVRMTPDEDGTLAPRVPMPKVGKTMLQLQLHYSQKARLYGGEKAPILTDLTVSYDRSVSRLSSRSNPIASAKSLVSHYAGCYEAAKFRGRALALARIHKTISGEVFRFPLEEQ